MNFSYTSKDNLVEFITLLFNFIFDSGHFLNQWSNGLLVPLHKCSNYSPNNSGGITLLNMLSKLFTRVINNLLTNGLKHMVSILKHSLYLEVGGALLTVCMCCTC